MVEVDEERERERATILRRRAQLAACAVVAGVALPQCEPTYCLSVLAPDRGGSASGGTQGATSGAGAAATHGGAAGENSGDAGFSFCLSIAAGAGSGGAPSLGEAGAAGQAGAGGEGAAGAAG